MKMIIAVIQDNDSAKLLNALMHANFRATKLSSTGGFLKAGNTTFMIGVEDKQVDEVLQIIKDNCQSRDQLVSSLPPMVGVSIDSYVSHPIEVKVGGATVFVLPVEQYFKY